MAEVVLLTLIIALPLTLALSALIAWRYRSTVRKLMRLAPSPTDSDSPGVVQSELGAIAMVPADLKAMLPATLSARERQLNLSLALCSLESLAEVSSESRPCGRPECAQNHVTKSNVLLSQNVV